jgi:hypothetical protein
MVDFNLIRGRIQKHRLSSIVHYTFEALNDIQRGNDKSFPIWNLLALLKWTYLHTTDSILRTPIKPHEFYQLLTLVRQFETKYQGISFQSKRSFDQSFKIIAYQQFPLQDPFHNSILSRQIVLYLRIYSKYNVAGKFEQHAKIKLKSFLEYSFFTYFFLNLDQIGKRYDGYLMDSYFSLFKLKWGESELKKYLELLTITSPTDFTKLHKLNSEILQLYETVFFTTKPFVRFRDSYRIPHRSIFNLTLKHFIYSYLKENCPLFPEDFGFRLEKYVELGLTENKIPYLNETSLKAKYNLGKVSDFLVLDNILVEVKAIELHPRSGVIRSKEILVNDLSKSIIKAYCQLIETATKINSEAQHFGIVVTYKEMYLGFGNDAWQEFLCEPIEEYCKTNSLDVSVLPPQNLFFINIEDWDFIMQAIKTKGVSLKEILLKARELNLVENIAEKISMMEQVIKRCFYSPHLTLNYLKDAYLELDILPDKGLVEAG